MPLLPAARVPGDELTFHSQPDLTPASVEITKDDPDPGPDGDDIFLTPQQGPTQNGVMILNKQGTLLWFEPVPQGDMAADLQVQRYEGQRVLTWWQGYSGAGVGAGEDVIDNSSYRQIAVVHAANGLSADLHEFRLTPQGTALITAYDPILCNLSAAGGPSYGGVTDSVFQEIDVKTGLVMYEWTSIDHVAMSESYEPASHSSTAYPYDFFHLNSISVDRDGTLLISSRNTWTVYKLAASSGQILWRLGGRHSSFKMGAGTGTAWQHDPRELANGSIGMFDNGDSPKAHDQSRAIVVSPNQQTGVATLITRLTHTPALLVESQGSMQALGNGDWFVGWGQEPYFSEFSPEGQLLFDAHFPPHDESYRAYRFEWAGTPAHPPTFAFQSGGTGAGTVYASWNGATLVASWRVLAGESLSSLSTVALAPRSGFETAIAVPAGTLGSYVQVQALGAAGQVLGSSGAVSESSL
jgi:hypothetical protein